MKNPETNPYPHKFHVTYDDSKFHDEFKDLKPGETLKDKEITVAGRIYTVRTLSSKLIFYGGWFGFGRLPVVEGRLALTRDSMQTFARRPTP